MTGRKESAMKKLHIELDSLGFELLYQEAMGNTERVEEIKHRMREIQQTLNSFYADPMTQAVSL